MLANALILTIVFLREDSNTGSQKKHLSYQSAISERDFKTSEFLNLDDPEKAYDLFKAESDQMTSAEFESFQQQILTVWAEEDPAKVTKILSSLTSKKTKEIVIENTAKGWAINDVSKRNDFFGGQLMGNVNTELFDSSYAVLIDQYARENVVSAVQILEGLDSEAFQAERVYTTTGKYTDLDYSDSLDWASSLKPDAVRNLAMIHLFDKYDESEAGTLSTTIKEHHEKLRLQGLQTFLTLIK